MMSSKYSSALAELASVSDDDDVLSDAEILEIGKRHGLTPAEQLRLVADAQGPIGP